MPPSNTRRKRWRWRGAGAAAVLVAGGAAIVFGPAAPWLVDQVLDGQRAWRLGHLDVDGVSGSWLGDLRAERLTIADEEGVWLEARNAQLHWRPQNLIFGDIRLDRAQAESATVLRMPVLLEPRPRLRTQFDAHVGDIRIETLSLMEDVVGVAAVFTGRLSLVSDRGAIDALTLDLQRTDSDSDRALITYRAPGPDFTLDAEVEGAAGGVFSRALGVPDLPVQARAEGDVEADVGQARYSASIGEANLTTGSARWDGQRWRHEARAQLDLIPAMRALARRIGASIAIEAEGAADGRFSATAETPFMAIVLSGQTDPEDGEAFSADVVATTQRVSDIAREPPFELGPARLEGELRRARGSLALNGVVRASEIRAFGESASFTGPLRAQLTDARFSLNADLRTANDAGLFADARLVTELAYDRVGRRFTLDKAELTGDAVAMDAQGWATRGAGEFAGLWRVRQLQEIIPDLTGEASGRWRAFPEPAVPRRIWVTTVDGSGAGVDGRGSVLSQLLGASPRFDGRFRYEDHGTTVSHARIDGANVRAGGTGRIVRGDAAIALELTAQGPINVGGAVIDGAADATGRLTGPIERPTVSAVARLSSFSAGGVVVVNPVVDFVLAPRGRAYAGRATVEGVASGQPLTGGAGVAFTGSVLSLSDIDAQWGGLLAQGSAAFAPRGVSATLDINGAFDGLVAGVTGRVAGALDLTPDAVTLDAQLADARAGELVVRTAAIHASGPVRAIQARYSLRGRLRRAPLTFAGTATINGADGIAATADGRGVLAGVDVFTRAPMEARIHGRDLDASLNVAVGDGAVIASWRERGEAVAAAARIEDAPLGPLAAIWNERATGRIDGNVSLRSAGGGLSGDADMTLTDARFAGRQRGALDMRIVGELTPSRLSAEIDATSADGLVARFEADAPVSTSAAPLRIALIPERRGRGTWSVRGPAEGLWAAARLQDQSLQGQLDGAGEISFGAGHLSGAGHIEIIDGRFEDKLTGVSLVDLDVRVALGATGVTIERFSASGARGGRLTATGGSSSPTVGRIAVRVDDIRVANRPDARARASGDLALEWQGLHSEVTGALEISEAELDIAASPTSGIPTLDVIEVNRPGFDDESDEETPARNGSTEMNVRITAPGRVFTRGRGVNAEWALDLRVAGTAREPLLFGEARAVRGTVSLSGQPFEIDDARILFAGDPLDAQINLTATRDTADLTARVRLIGTARDPEISFSSNPPLPEDEILPQVLFGRSVEDLSPFEAAQLAASLAAISGRSSLDLLDAARSAAGLDRLAVREDQEGGLLVAGGVYLTRDVYFELARTGLGQTQTQVEWMVRPRLVLITSFLGNGDQRVSLRWRRESD